MTTTTSPLGAQAAPPALGTVAVVGAGRVGTLLAEALGTVALGRGADAAGADVVLLAVPDGEIAVAAAAVAPGPFVGHLSGATGLDALAPHERRFGLHPLMTVPTGAAPDVLRGATAAVAGSDDEALAVAQELAQRLGLRALEVDDADRALYHAGACVASNFLVTVEGAAERLASGAGVDRAALVPLVRATVDHWAARGAADALTGPIARGDEATVRAHRAALRTHAPSDLPLYDALADATRALAGRSPTLPKGSDPFRRVGEDLVTVRRKAEVRALVARHRRAARTVGFVPTMGALHEGHLALVRAAREACDVVVVSLFVNPTQFDERADLDAYPRDEARDAALLAQAGADVLFAPAAGEVYPDGFATTVRIGGPVAERFEAASRGAAHFDGVATVVTKLVNVVAPDVAFFGRKDAQQAVVVRQVARDLDLPVEIRVEPTVRDGDGLALSSRNARLSADERERALSLSRGLQAAADAHGRGQRDAGALSGAVRTALADAGVEPEYVCLVHPDTFEELDAADGGPALLAVAARVGATRLIDNVVLEDQTP